jgi:hypothetical protein
MKIISHRGYWKAETEKNKKIAFDRTFSIGLGTESDVRDFNGRLVISHDIANGTEITLVDLLALADSYQVADQITLALNVKSDGLSELIGEALLKYKKKLDCFVFDMSIPDMRGYLDNDIPVFTRMSEVELQPAWLEQCEGIWLDGFETEWYSNTLITDLLSIHNKRVCIVSPELHKRNHLALWERIKPLASEPLLMLCTDFPQLAQEFFKKD